MSQVGFHAFNSEDDTPKFKEYVGRLRKEEDFVPELVGGSVSRGVSRVSCGTAGRRGRKRPKRPKRAGGSPPPPP